MRTAYHRVAVVLLVLTAAVGCTRSASEPSPVIQAPPTSSTSVVPAFVPTTEAPPAPAPFTGTVTAVTPSDVSGSWRPGCPVGPDQLSLLHVSYWGFDNQPHVGTMVIKSTVTADVLKIFGALYAERFPILQMQTVDAYRGSDPASMEADNTSGFNCRYAVAAGPPQWSAHAYGEAIDVNPIENPYILSGTVMPPAGAPFVNRNAIRPGMAVLNGQLVEAFASAGWFWGGRWSDHPDYQHFSKTGE